MKNMKEKYDETCVSVYTNVENMMDDMRNRMKDETGSIAAEYGLLLAVIVFGIITAATVMFDPLKAFFLSIIDKIQKMATG